MNRLPFGPVLTAIFASFDGLFRGRAALQVEIVALRELIAVLQRSAKRPTQTRADRLLWN